MKNLKFISLMLGCLAAVCVTFTSCDDDDDDNRALTPTEIQTAFNAVRGDYNGKMLYASVDSKTNKNVTDTVNIAWSIQSDSIMTIRNFPISLLGKNVTDSTVRKAIEAQGPQNLQCYIGFIRVSPVTFLINPNTVTLNLNYGGAAHKIQIPFFVNSYYSYGQQGNSALAMQIIEGGVYVDNSKTSVLKQNVPFGFTFSRSSKK